MRVSLFVTCLADRLRPRLGLAAAELLERAGCEVLYSPRQTCCGQPGFNCGFHDEARAVARSLIAALDDGAEAVVAPSGSCVAMVRRYGELFAGDPAWRERAAALAGRTFELSSFLVDHLGRTAFGARRELRASWHDSCHGLRELGLRAAPRRLLAEVAGLELVEAPLAAECCGFGGAFAARNEAISVAMADRKIDELEALGVDVVTGADLSCLLQLGGRLERRGSRIRALHFAELIAEGLPAEAPA
ncbi:MAG: (Fe-S)-binding protein [Planctomycetota bacterium]|nr:MAG: (Fe-S)-binding protein [Planctomycetota bacterium]